MLHLDYHRRDVRRLLHVATFTDARHHPLVERHLRLLKARIVQRLADELNLLPSILRDVVEMEREEVERTLVLLDEGDEIKEGLWTLSWSADLTETEYDPEPDPEQQEEGDET